MKKIAIIVAGGSGQRMGSAVPKQFLTLQGRPLLWYTLHTFLQSYDDMEIILVLPAEHIATGEALVSSLNSAGRITIVPGGATRFHSVQNGLAQVKEESVVFIHDGVRCLVSTQLIQRCYGQALVKGSAIPAVAATDSIRITEGAEHIVADRSTIQLVQTPQTFMSSIILPAFQQPYTELFTDEATVAEANGTKVFLIEGEYDNIKVTRPVDLLIAEKIIEARSFL